MLEEITGCTSFYLFYVFCEKPSESPKLPKLKWVIYEFSIILIIRFLNISKNSTKIIRILYYSIASLSSIILIFFIIIINNFTFISFINYKFIINFFILILILKLRIFPFYN